MIELTCYDDNWNTVSYLTQWDLNRAIYIENPEFSKAPVALFSNNDSNSYLVATELTDNNDKIKIIVPNLLLQQCRTISLGLCGFDMINNINNTKYILKLPVRKLAMPTNYVFTDNAIDVNWLRSILGEYINKGITDIEDATEYSLSTINTSLLDATNSIDALTTEKLGDINHTASSQMNAINDVAQTQINTLNTLGTSQVDSINNTAQAQIEAINATAYAQTSAIDSLANGKLADINVTASTQTNAISAAATAQLGAINNTAQAQIEEINTTAQAQAKSIGDLTTESIAKLGYYIDATEVIILSESDTINAKHYNTFVMTDDGGMSEKNFYTQVYQYDDDGHRINVTTAAIGEEIDISEASYITLWGSGSVGTFTVTYRMSRNYDVINTITDLISRVSLLEEKTSNL